MDDHLGTVLNAFPYTLAPGASSPEVIVADTAAGPVVNIATWTAATALGGYTIDDTIAVNFEDISATGTAVTLTDDSTATFPIGFSFDFYGTTYTDFWVSSNGFLATNGASNGCCSGQNLPNPATPNGVIAGWWEDMNPSGGGTHHYQVLGSAPNRRLIFQVTDVPHYSSGNLVTLQYKLYETTNVIEVHYQAAPSDGGEPHRRDREPGRHGGGALLLRHRRPDAPRWRSATRRRCRSRRRRSPPRPSTSPTPTSPSARPAW